MKLTNEKIADSIAKTVSNHVGLVRLTRETNETMNNKKITVMVYLLSITLTFPIFRKEKNVDNTAIKNNMTPESFIRSITLYSSQYLLPLDVACYIYISTTLEYMCQFIPHPLILFLFL